MQSTAVPISNVIAIFVTFGIMVAAPFVAGALGARKMNKNGIALLAGFLSFFVTQIVVRIPLLGALSQNAGFVQFAQSNKWLYAAFLAITASLFEEGGRLLTARFIVKPKRYLPGNAIWHGVGHGGIECLYFGLTAYLNNIIFVLLINSGQTGAIAAQLPPGQFEQLASSLIQTPFWLFLVSGLERVMTLCVQIGLSVLMFEALRKHSFKLVLLPFAIHAVIDFVAPGILQLGLDQTLGVILSELVVLLFAVASIVMMKKLIGKWREEEQAQVIPETIA